MAEELPDFMDALATLQRGISAPLGSKAIQSATAEPQAQVGVFPSFINVEESSRAYDLTHSSKEAVHTVGMHLVFARGEQKYAVRMRRLWWEAVIDAIEADPTLSGTCIKAEIAADQEATYEPFEWGQEQYVAANFTLEVRCGRS